MDQTIENRLDEEETFFQNDLRSLIEIRALKKGPRITYLVVAGSKGREWSDPPPPVRRRRRAWLGPR